MKRKRKNKKGKPKVSVASKNEALSSGAIVNLEDDANLDGDVNNDNKSESAMEVDTPSSTGTDQLNNLANINPDGSIDRRVEKSVGRVKVKLKTSRTVGSQPTSSDAHTQSDTDKSSPQIGLERQGVVSEKKEDSVNSLPEVKIGASGNASKKAGSIKIKSSKVLGSNVNHSTDPIPAQSESTRKREPKMADQDSNKQELDAALMIIKKVMKMDAAEPFNAPVNPEALGIPDYFDVIDTPMDFGTICSNLEKGDKYTNSEDVFDDVQYIWNNCYKYNNKGDYILDLLRRVKKNFAKYWAAAGLYSGKPRGTDGVESTQVAPSDQGKVNVKGGQSKQKVRKGHGRRHKSDCLCAICVLKRRRREREENARIANGQHEANDNSLPQDFQLEESSLAESPSGENSSSDMDGSLDPHADAEVEEKGVEKMGIFDQQYRPVEEKPEEEEDDDEGDEEEGSDTEMKEGDNGEALEQSEKLREEPNKQLQPKPAEKAASAVGTDKNKENTVVQLEDEIVADKQSKETQDRHKKVEAYENLQFENPMLLDLCGSLFPNNSKSIWSGPHSLVQHHRTSRSSSIHAAINMLMK